jgi:glycosyltransferase involved in cell wall biosynthesis
LIVKNEEATRATCLRSVGDLVEEIIVVDTGFSDQSKQVAAGCGARVFDFPWVDSLGAARNASLEPATGAWILWLDGDEFFDGENRAKLQALFSRLGDEPVGYIMKLRAAPEAAGGAATLVDQRRLFRNDPTIRWSYRVHGFWGHSRILVRISGCPRTLREPGIRGSVAFARRAWVGSWVRWL